MSSRSNLLFGPDLCRPHGALALYVEAAHSEVEHSSISVVVKLEEMAKVV